jgi:predicted nucleic-acid-binding protein
MEAIKQIIRTPRNHEVRIKIPPYIPENDLVEIILILRRKPNDFEQKIDLLKTAMNDELFLNDLKEVAAEFENIDNEGWEE